jgi:hypothetical protein
MLPVRTALLAACLLALAAYPLRAQDHGAHAGHAGMPNDMSAAAMPTMAGQPIFATVGEIIRLLEADPSTDWSKVDLDALREHLRDMHRVMQDADAEATPVEGGVRLVVTGEGAVRDAIRRLLFPHAGALEGEMPVKATPSHHDRGLVFTVVARDPSDTATVTRIRALGFAGLLAAGAHHQRHHLAIAKGEIAAGAHAHH